MIKKILQIITFLFSIGVFACDCDDPEITEKYIQSDFVAKAKIIKNYKNENLKELYKADIIIRERFKGERFKGERFKGERFKGERLNSIYVAGRSDGLIGSSCAISIPENTELIIYAHKSKDGKYIIGMCSGLLYLSKRNTKRQKRELDILKTFKSKNINFTNKISYWEKSKLYKELKQFKGIELEKDYGIYEITFSSDLTIKNVTEISGFGNSIDQKLIEIVKKTEWASFDKGVKDKVPEDSKLLIGIYYYPKGKEYPSFLSQWYL